MGSYKEWYAEWKKNRQQNNTGEASSDTSQSNSYKDWYKAWYAQRHDLDGIASSITNRTKSWMQNHNTYLSNYNYRFSGRKGTYEDKYVGDSADWLQNITGQKERFDKEASNILAMLDKYGDYFDPKWAQSIRDTLTSASAQQADILKYATGDNDYWAQFGSQDVYGQWQRSEGYKNKYADMSYEDIQGTLGSMEDGEEKQWLDAYQYQRLTEAEDFAEKSRYVSTANGTKRSWYQISADLYPDEASGFDWTLYDAINGNEDARAYLSLQGSTYYGPESGGIGAMLGSATEGKSEARHMSEREVGIFNYLYATQGRDAAQQYYDYLLSDLNARQREADEAYWAGYAKENPFAASAFSILESPMKGVSYIGQALDYLDDGSIDQNAGYNKFSYTNSAIRNEVSDIAEKKWGKVGSFAYQTGMSMGDFLFTTAVSGGNKALSLAIMGTGAAADTTIAAKDRGLSDGQAFALGTIAGAAEIAMEKIGLDALFKTDMLNQSVVKYILNNALSEGVEEVGTDLINTVADCIIAQDKSQWQAAVNYYKEKGKTDAAAFALALADKAMELGVSFAGGAISGGVMGGSVAGINTGVNNHVAQKTYGDDPGARVGEALEIDPNNTFAQQMQQKLDMGGRLSGGQLNRLVQQNESAMVAQDQQAIQGAVTQRLNELGETGDVNTIAQVLTKQAKYQSDYNRAVQQLVAQGATEAEARRTASKTVVNPLSNSEKRVIAESKYGSRVANEMNAENIQTGGYSSRWAENIGTNRIHAQEYNRMAETADNGAKNGEIATASERTGLAMTGELGQDSASMEAAAVERLTELGESGDVHTIAAALTKQAAGAQLSNAEQAAISGSRYGSQVATELRAGRNRTGENGPATGQRLQMAAENARGTDATQVQTGAQQGKVALEDGAKNGEIATTSERTGLAMTEKTKQIADDGVTRQVSTGKAVEPKKIVAIDNGKVMIETASGTVAAEDIAFGDADTDMLWRIPASFNGITPAGANGVIHAYQGNLPVATYLHGAAQEFQNGYYNLPSGGEAAGKLAPWQRSIIYELGQKAAGENIARAQAKATAAKKEAVAYKNATTGAVAEKSSVAVSGMESTTGGQKSRRKGVVRGDGVKISDLKKTFNDTQGKAYKYLRTVAEVTGIDIVLYRSEAGPDGQFQGEQGRYSRREPGTIYIDLNAGLTDVKDADDLAKYAMLRTFSHEFTHFIEKWNPAQYNELRKVVFDTLTQRGQDVNDLIELQQGQNPGMDYETASREVVAEAMTDILPDANFVQELAQKHKRIFAKLLEKLKAFVKNLRDYYNSIGHNSSREANALKEQVGENVKYLDSIVKVFDQAAVQAVENYQNTKTAVEVAVSKKETTTTDTDGGIENGAERADQSTQTFYRGRKTGASEAESRARTKIGDRSGVSEAVGARQENPATKRQLRGLKSESKDFGEDAYIAPPKGSALHNVQDHFKEYNIDCHIVKASSWKRKALAFSQKGIVYISEEIDGDTLATAVAHEATHVMKQCGFKPYLEFIGRTPDALNMQKNAARDLIVRISEHRGVDAFELDDIQRRDLYDELNATVYGIYKGGILANTAFNYGGWVSGAFNDFDGYIRELDGIHEQYKKQFSVAEGYRESSADSNKQYQQRTNTLTNREVLALAASELQSAELSTAERDALDIFQQRLSKLEALQKERAEQGRLYKEQQFGPNVDRKAAVQTRNRMQVLDGKIEKANAEVLSIEDKRVLKQVLQKARTVVEKQQQAKDRETLKRYRETRQEAEAVKKNRAVVEKAAKALMKMLAHPTKEAHVPMALQKPLQEFLESIDFASQTQLAGKGMTIRDVAYTRALSEVRAAIAGQRSAMDGAEDGTFELDIPDSFLEEIDAHIREINNATKGLDLTTNRVYDMRSDELADLGHMLTVINKVIRGIDKLHMAGAKARVSQLGQDTRREMSRRKPVKGEAGMKAMWANYTPWHAFRRMGKAAQQIFKGLMQGQAKLARTIASVVQFSKKTYTAKEAKNWERTKRTIKLDSGKIITMTQAQIMSFYCLSKREHAMGHMMGAGIRISTIKNDVRNAIQQRNKEFVQKGHYTLTEQDIARINSLLTDRQRAVAEAMQQYMQNVGGRLNNEISMARWDYMAATEDHYYPIKTDDSTRDVKDPGQEKTNLWALLNKSFTKGLTPGANNAIVVESIFDVFADHMSEVAEYNAFALPLVDAMKWFNYRERIQLDDTHIKDVGVQKSIRDALGTSAVKYFVDLMTDINSSQKAGRHENLAGQILSRSKVASVGWNLRVAIQQPTAILRASLVLDMPSLLKGTLRIGTKKLAKEMQQYSGIALWKSMGYYDLNVSRSVREQIKGDSSLIDKFNELGMWLPGKMDEMTWARIWAATKAKVAREQRLTGEALLQSTAELFEEVVYQTQVADSVLTRSSMMRSKGQFMKEATSFMAEPTVGVNILLSAFQDYEAGHATWDKAKRGLMIGFYGYVLPSVANAMVTALMDAWRDDDEQEEFLEKYTQALFGKEKFYDGNLFSELNPLEKIVFVKDFISLLKGYTVAPGYAELFQSGIDLVTNFKRFMEGQGSITGYGVIYQSLQVLGNVTGFGASNIAREVVGIWNNTIGKLHPDKIIHRYGAATDKLYQAIINGDADYFERLSDNYETEDALDSAIRKGLRDNDPRIKEAAEARFSGDFDRYKELFHAIKGEGNFTFNQIMGAINAEINDLEEKAYGDNAVEHYYDAVVRDNQADAELIYEELVAKKIADGYLRHEAEDAIATGFVNQVEKAYMDGEITRDRAIELLADNTDKDESEVKKWDFEMEYGFAWSERVRKYRLGQISEQDLISAVMDIEGESREDAEAYIDFLDLEMAHEDVDITAADAAGYFKYAEPAGISIDVYLDYKNKASQCESDLDENGNSISGSKKAKILAIIDAMELTREQKDALYYANGWAESTLYEAPWH